MGDPTPGRDGAAWFTDKIANLQRQIDGLKAPSGTQRANAVGRLERTVDYLAGLMTFAAAGASWNSGLIAHDATTRWYAGTSPVEITGLNVPTNRMTVEASVGEMSIQPGGAFIVGYVSFRVFDGNDIEVPQAKTIAGRAGRIYYDDRIGMTISSGPQPATIPDRVAYPPPYRVAMQYGTWADVANTSDCSIQFNAPSLNVEIIGDGVPD